MVTVVRLMAKGFVLLKSILHVVQNVFFEYEYLDKFTVADLVLDNSNLEHLLLESA